MQTCTNTTASDGFNSFLEKLPIPKGASTMLLNNKFEY